MTQVPQENPIAEHPQGLPITEDPRTKSISGDPKENPINEDSLRHFKTQHPKEPRIVEVQKLVLYFFSHRLYFVTLSFPNQNM